MEDGKRIFVVFEAKEPYEIVEKRFDITDEWEKRQAAYDKVDALVKGYTHQEWLNIKDDRYTDVWWRQGGNHRTWIYRGEIQMEISYESK